MPATSPLLFPAFIYGDKTTCQRKMKAVAKKWGKCYREGVDFPEPKLVAIPPGSVVFTDENTSDFIGKGYSISDDMTCATVADNPKQQGLHIQWRLYMMEMLEFEISRAVMVPHAERFIFRRRYLSFVCRYPWGALSVATDHCLFNAIDLTIPRVEGVLLFWEELSTIKYIDFYERPISLDELMVFHFKGAIAMWVDHATGNIRTDLRIAVDQMRVASEDEIWNRLVKRLREYADTAPRLEHRTWLKSPGVIEAALTDELNSGREWYDDLTTGQLGPHSGFLHHLHKKYPGA